MTTEAGKSWFRVEALLSVVMHVALLGVCAWYFRNPLTTAIVAAGEGQGSGESVIEVGTVEGKLLSFTPPREVSSAGDEPNTPNNEVVSTEVPPPDPSAEVLPSTKSTPDPKDKTTDRPTDNRTSQLVSPTPMRGTLPNTSVMVGSSPGSPVPSMTAGVGVSSGANLSGATGVPGGSAYGRLIQRILSNNYNPPATSDVSGEQYVIINLRIARDGRILSVVGDRVAPNSFKKRSANALINNAVERAVLAVSKDGGLPPFPNGFLMGAQEAVAEVWFRYPK